MKSNRWMNRRVWLAELNRILAGQANLRVLFREGPRNADRCSKAGGCSCVAGAFSSRFFSPKRDRTKCFVVWCCVLQRDTSASATGGVSLGSCQFRRQFHQNSVTAPAVSRRRSMVINGSEMVVFGLAVVRACTVTSANSLS